GTATNTFVGNTDVQAGLLLLNRPATALPVPASLFIGTDLAGNLSGTVRLLANNQILDNAAVRVRLTGLLDLNNHSDTVGPLTLSGGSVSSGSGTLTLASNVTTLPTNVTAVISGHLNLTSVGTSRTFDIGDGPVVDDLLISANLS